MKTLPKAEVASMTVRGPYGEADVEALAVVMGWVGENGYEVAGTPRVLYMHNPEMTVEEDMWEEGSPAAAAAPPPA